MELDSGLGIPSEQPWFPTIRFSSPGEGLYFGKRPTFPSAVGAPFWNHCPDLRAVITLWAECQTPWILDGSTLSSRSPSFSREGREGVGRGLKGFGARFPVIFVFHFNSVNIY